MTKIRTNRIYPDTSYWVAMRCRADSNHEAWLRFHPQIEHARLLWSPWTHFEVYNTFRQMTLGEDAPLTAAEARQLIASLEKEVNRGCWDPITTDWREQLREAREISAEFGYRYRMRSGDVVHVAIARLAGADAFITCDEDQCELAQAVGLEGYYIH
jgi:predicted nucleic acid-binding protein